MLPLICILFFHFSFSHDEKIDDAFYDGFVLGLIRYHAEFIDTSTTFDYLLDYVQNDYDVYKDVVWHEFSVKGRYHDYDSLKRCSTSEIWKSIFPIPLFQCNPGLMPFVFIDFLYLPKLKSNYRFSSPFKHNIKRRFDYSWMKCSPEMTLYQYCVDPLYYLNISGYIPKLLEE